jgi:hypothetical protein
MHPTLPSKTPSRDSRMNGAGSVFSHCEMYEDILSSEYLYRVLEYFGILHEPNQISDVLMQTSVAWYSPFLFVARSYGRLKIATLPASIDPQSSDYNGPKVDIMVADV